MTRWRSSQKAVTLVEVAIAVAITVIVLSGILALFYESVFVTKKMNQLFIATNLAKNRLERLRNLQFDTLPMAAETDTYLDKDGNSVSDGEFVRNTVITTNYNGDQDLTQAAVTVDYKMKGQFSGNPVTLTTVFVDE